MVQMNEKQGSEEVLEIVGRNAYVTIGGVEKVPAKIDTGADSSSIWASDIEVSEDGKLRFKLFAKDSPFYTGEVIESTDYKVSVIRSSNGEEQIRYRVKIPVEISGHKVLASLTLANRKKNHFPILIGRRTLSGKFLVDVRLSEVKQHPKNAKTSPLNKELNEDPYKFHQKYINSN
ncbi:ATP-dependent zinc protease [Candidatus Saccharibacteria bacterium]|nr:ATP-dependent zinc protease [Candidatus Saccharibacteria bacterium]